MGGSYVQVPFCDYEDLYRLRRKGGSLLRAYAAKATRWSRQGFLFHYLFRYAYGPLASCIPRASRRRANVGRARGYLLSISYAASRNCTFIWSNFFLYYDGFFFMFQRVRQVFNLGVVVPNFGDSYVHRRAGAIFNTSARVVSTLVTSVFVFGSALFVRFFFTSFANGNLCGEYYFLYLFLL